MTPAEIEAALRLAEETRSTAAEKCRYCDCHHCSATCDMVPDLADVTKRLAAECERLRKLAGNEHAKSCAVLTAAVRCDCGWHGDGEASSEILERERDAAIAERDRLIAEVRAEAEHCFTYSRLPGYDTGLLQDIGDDLIAIADCGGNKNP